MFRINSDNTFSKENQKKLRAQYEAAISEVWKGDKKMINYEMKSIAYLIPICEGKFLIPISKITIEKDFCFGYSDMGQGLSYEENNKRINSIKKNLSEYFINKNTSHIDFIIERIQDVLNKNFSERYHAKHYIKYYNSPENCIIHDWGIEDTFNGYKPFASGTSYEINEYDLNKILLGYSIFKEDTIDKLNTYLKKYGTSKIHISTYWIDR